MPNVPLKNLRKTVDNAVQKAQITDIHTHIFPPVFGKLLHWGVDEFLTYHYLITETFRWIKTPYDDFWKLTKQQKADIVWKTLFIENSPVSEACTGALTILKELGLSTASRSLKAYREFFRLQKVEKYIGTVFETGGIKEVVMTNSPFDADERAVWEKGFERDPRFHAALRLDPLLNTWPMAWSELNSMGYNVGADLSETTLKEVRRFLADWIDKMDAVYMAVVVPPDFDFPENSPRAALIAKCVLPVGREKNVPFALMIGAKKLINPDLRLGGDGVGKAKTEAVEYMCAHYPENKFLVTMLSLENQHELCVTVRKFRNLMVFGCWWFLNNPSIIDKMTRMRMEMLGTSFIPQHSDVHILDQLIYKWSHSRRLIGEVLYDKYRDMMETGWKINKSEIERDVAKLFGGNFWSFLGRK